MVYSRLGGAYGAFHFGVARSAAAQVGIDEVITVWQLFAGVSEMSGWF